MGQKVSTIWGIVQEDDFGNQRTLGAKFIDPAGICVQPKTIDDFHYPEVGGAEDEDASSHSDREEGEAMAPVEGEHVEGEHVEGEHVEAEAQIPAAVETEEEKRVQ
mmetsp:Transcript_10448/g.17934  ORF Transcript_10448/g.17934 Transcript_10448/m.17934 type:complete len:106 (-) Transcript_10448:69-386(-)|eukprot:CAMPEP_0184700382 /NCGR_PEP_ID=MMETSP0313-20130426/12802_1 /TAXON_ID=2792 /ORGANISM="Porphyridium aerugineum, Strain SAG 1380-2" /LENGTH=105 /DNA_ID=CAMNT_0027160025 /DNA_START=189 /DNA_END=506 /DNA_ORIENTATION=+